MEERLQKFVKLVESGSFTKAAQVMHVSQPALTVAIAKLERELGSQLLVRDTRPLELTDAGKIAYEAGISQGIVLDNLRTGLSDLTGRRPHVSIGMIDSVATVLSAYAEPLRALGDAAELSVIVNGSHSLRDAVSIRDLDVAIVVADETDSSELPIAEELMVMVASPHEKPFKEAEMKKGMLSDFISFPAASSSYRSIAEKMEEMGIVHTTKLQSSSPEIITHMVVSGEGVAVLPYFLVRSQLITRSLVVLTHQNEPVIFTRHLTLVAPPSKHQAGCVNEFIVNIESVLKAAHTEAMKAVKTQEGKK